MTGWANNATKGTGRRGSRAVVARNAASDDDDVMVASEREKRQPQWLQTLINDLRRAVKNAEAERDEAEAAARAMSGKLDAKSVRIVVNLPDGSTIGLPDDVEITFRLPDSMPLSVSLDEDGVLIDGGFQTTLAVHPVTTAQMRATVKPR